MRPPRRPPPLTRCAAAETGRRAPRGFRVVAMADSLGMTTTAEGAENDEEAQMIRELGCTKLQGYHFGRPMPASDVLDVMARQTGSPRAESA